MTYHLNFLSGSEMAADAPLLEDIDNSSHSDVGSAHVTMEDAAERLQQCTLGEECDSQAKDSRESDVRNQTQEASLQMGGASNNPVVESKDCGSKPLKSNTKSKSKSPSPVLLEGQGASRPGSGKSRPREAGPQSVRFFSGNPSVETTEGILHLYKDE